MNALILLTDANAGGQVQQIANTFGVDWPHLLAQIISFSIVCFLLQRFAFKPVLQILEQRQQQIAQGVADRKQISAELDQAGAERHRIILQADATATQLIEEAHAAAARLREKEMQRAVTAAEQVIVKSREATLQEHDRMLVELKKEIGILVVQATGAITRKVLTPEDQRRMAEETVTQLNRAA